MLAGETDKKENERKKSERREREENEVNEGFTSQKKVRYNLQNTSANEQEPPKVKWSFAEVFGGRKISGSSRAQRQVAAGVSYN